MIELPPHLLRSYVAVADAQGYARGGASLFLAQPTVHQHVRQLERLTGAKLVEQVGKRVQLTSQGRLVYDHALRAFEQADTLERALADDRSLAAGELSIAAPSTAGDFLVPRICAGFRGPFPGITVGVAIINDPTGVDQAVAAGQADMGLHSKTNHVPGLTKVTVIEERLVGIAPPGHPLGNSREAIRPQDLVGERFVAFQGRLHRARNPAPVPFTQLVDDWFAAADVWPNVRFAATSHEGIKNAVRLGVGVAIVASVAVRPDDESLCTFELAHAPRRSFVLVYRQSGWRSSAWKAFVEYTRSGDWANSVLP